MDIQTELRRILLNGEANPSPDERGRVLGFEVKNADSGEGIVVEYGDMYNPPDITEAQLKEIKSLFGASAVHLETISMSGCETCDWGSWYGHEIHLIGVTANHPAATPVSGSDPAATA